tara:strand:- start:21279 stop:22841 length:1563 start_codon:yes stop_codon:yes gene_type:complete
MKSYLEHLKTTNSFVGSVNLSRKPVFRSSAIFPIFFNNYIDPNVLFLGYWLIKKSLEVTLIITIRDKKGKEILRNSLTINQCKSYKINIKKILENIYHKNIFWGSAEFEIYSSKDLVFPFPALVINYSGKKSSTFVHTTGRIFNDFDDLRANTAIHVPESGFDIIPNDGFDSFFSFVNGPYEFKNQILHLKIINSEKEIIRKKIKLKNILPYESCFIFFLNEKEKKFLKGNKGAVIIKHNLKGFFPRFLCGNINKEKSITSLTHSYFDSKKVIKNAYWKNPDQKEYYDSILTFPIFYENRGYTELALYPIYPKSDLTFDLEIYNMNGKILQVNKSIFKINGYLSAPKYLSISKYINKTIINKKKIYAKLIINGKNVPSRIKVGLNIGNKNKYDVPSNVCFNAVVPNDNTKNKPSSFKWAPILNNKNSKIVLSNFSTIKKGFKKANITLKVWREKDGKYLEKKIQIKDNGSYYFELNENKKIKSFIGKESSWVTFESDNPFINGFYFEDMGHGIIGADHVF